MYRYCGFNRKVEFLTVVMYGSVVLLYRCEGSEIETVVCSFAFIRLFRL